MQLKTSKNIPYSSFNIMKSAHKAMSH